MPLFSSCLSGLSACLEAERYAFAWIRAEIMMDDDVRATDNLRAIEQWLVDRPYECRQGMGQLMFVDGETFANLRQLVKAEARDEREGELILASFHS